MDPGTILAATAGFIGSCIAQKCADATITLAWQKLKGSFQSASGRDPEPRDFVGRPTWVNSSTLEEMEEFFVANSALRRAQLVSQSLCGVRLLWVDDHPENNAWECAMLSAFGMRCRPVVSTADALAVLDSESFHLVISDIERQGHADEGIMALQALRNRAPHTPVIFYTGHVRGDLPVPFGAFGIADRPDDLLHLILDVVERTRI